MWTQPLRPAVKSGDKIDKATIDDAVRKGLIVDIDADQNQGNKRRGIMRTIFRKSELNKKEEWKTLYTETNHSPITEGLCVLQTARLFISLVLSPIRTTEMSNAVRFACF